MKARAKLDALRLGILDFGWLAAGQSAADALNQTFRSARRAEELGYERYWIGEHHLSGHACGSPIVLAAALAASTRTIRIGIGALLLAYYSPLKVAEDLRLLEALFGRLELGVGRGRADDARAHEALLDGRLNADAGMLSEAAFERKVVDLLGFLHDRLPEGHPHAGAPVLPELRIAPPVWICGAQSAAARAGQLGASFCLTLFHGGLRPPAVLDAYREAFRPSPELSQPRAAIAVAGVCAETEAQARALREAFPSSVYHPEVVGAPEQCAARLRELSLLYGVNDVLFLDIALGAEQRQASCKLLAEVCDLPGARRELEPLSQHA